MPFESPQTDFSNKSYVKFKKIYTFFLLFRSSILKLLYLCDFGSPRYEILSYGSPISLISKPVSQTDIGFYKKELFPISHDELIIDWFRRENLYGVPRVTVSTFFPQFDTRNTKFRVISITFYEI